MPKGWSGSMQLQGLLLEVEQNIFFCSEKKRQGEGYVFSGCGSILLTSAG